MIIQVHKYALAYTYVFICIYICSVFSIYVYHSMCILGAWHVCIWAHCMSIQYVCICVLFQTRASNICLFICIYLWFSIYMWHCEYVAACMTMSMCVSVYVWTHIHINVHSLDLSVHMHLYVSVSSVYTCVYCIWKGMLGRGNSRWCEHKAGSGHCGILSKRCW